MCGIKQEVKELFSISEYHDIHIHGFVEVKVWYCKKCQLLDIETNTPIAT